MSQEKNQASSSANDEVDLDELMDVSFRALSLLVALYLLMCFLDNSNAVFFCVSRTRS